LTATDQRSENEKDHEEATEHCGAVDVTVANCRHRNQREVDTLPVRQPLKVLEVGERIARVFHLHTESQKNRFVSPVANTMRKSNKRRVRKSDYRIKQNM